MRTVVKPLELEGLEVSYLQRRGADRYTSSCPKCGGIPHSNGELPDRFTVWMKSRTTGGALGWCRQCGYIWTSRKERIDPDAHLRWLEEREKREREIKDTAVRALELLQNERAWITYHQQLTGEIRQRYYERGLDDYWIEYWQLGYKPEKYYWSGDNQLVSPSLTIPVFEPVTWNIRNIRHRLLAPDNPGDKYRPERGGLPAELYFTDLDNEPKGKAFIVEGEFKAMTTYLTIDDPKLTVVGLPGKSPSNEIVSCLEDCEPIWMCLDPDAYHAVKGKPPIQRLAEMIGDRARIVYLPDKIDDMIQRKEIDKDAILRLMKQARKYYPKGAK